jgi:hypothetical protein
MKKNYITPRCRFSRIGNESMICSSIVESTSNVVEGDITGDAKRRIWTPDDNSFSSNDQSSWLDDDDNN